jgi:hypothetical protein
VPFEAGKPEDDVGSSAIEISVAEPTFTSSRCSREMILSPMSEEVGSFIIWSDKGPMEASVTSRAEGYAG